jgi:hypothetical protein
MNPKCKAAYHKGEVIGKQLEILLKRHKPSKAYKAFKKRFGKQEMINYHPCICK